ncbi:hypothetical protein X797_002778 [Metarhizium robertsii]|uniref:Uncharacterized protein n=1 Tax=Metarhizium robertsii TaxID=568076 RepID=A0A0A1V649_9HYPO|nr:hypothetical protein X797_002778 [Metarhizium robertsii]
MYHSARTLSDLISAGRLPGERLALLPSGGAQAPQVLLRIASSLRIRGTCSTLTAHGARVKLLVQLELASRLPSALGRVTTRLLLWSVLVLDRAQAWEVRRFQASSRRRAVPALSPLSVGDKDKVKRWIQAAAAQPEIAPRPSICLYRRQLLEVGDRSPRERKQASKLQWHMLQLFRYLMVQVAYTLVAPHSALFLLAYAAPWLFYPIREILLII